MDVHYVKPTMHGSSSYGHNDDMVDFHHDIHHSHSHLIKHVIHKKKLSIEETMKPFNQKNIRYYTQISGHRDFYSYTISKDDDDNNLSGMYMPMWKNKIEPNLFLVVKWDPRKKASDNTKGDRYVMNIDGMNVECLTYIIYYITKNEELLKESGGIKTTTLNDIGTFVQWKNKKHQDKARSDADIILMNSSGKLEAYTWKQIQEMARKKGETGIDRTITIYGLLNKDFDIFGTNIK